MVPAQPAAELSVSAEVPEPRASDRRLVKERANSWLSAGALEHEVPVAPGTAQPRGDLSGRSGSLDLVGCGSLASLLVVLPVVDDDR
jgi:hypothetical protein